MFRPLQDHHQGGYVKGIQIHRFRLKMCMHVMFLYYFVYNLTDDGFLRLKNTGETP